MEELIQLIDADVARAQVPSALPIIKGVNWRIERGQFWILGAPAGTGKTDLLCTVAGIQRPLHGCMLLYGENTEKMSEEELVQNRLKIAMIFTNGRLFNGLTVQQNIALPLSYHHDVSETELARRVGEALELTGLNAWADNRPDQITRNLHQRIGLARALALKPEVLLIDNPLGGVDPRQSRWWLDFLCTIKKETTIVVATEDLRPWLDVGTDFAVLREQQLELVGGREEIRQSKDVLVRELLTPVFESI